MATYKYKYQKRKRRKIPTYISPSYNDRLKNWIKAHKRRKQKQ